MQSYCNSYTQGLKEQSIRTKLIWARNRLFVLFENENDRTEHIGYNLLKVDIKEYNVKIDGRNFFDQPINGDIKTYKNIRKIATGQGDDYTTGCLLDFIISRKIIRWLQ